METTGGRLAGGELPALSIGVLSKRTGTKVQTIRYYEAIGLLPEAGRTEGGQRRYRPRDLDRLAFIRHARELGFGLEAIREFLDLSDNPGRPCAEVDRVAERHLSNVELRIERLQALRSELKRMLRECRQGTVGECRVLEVLRDHAQCLADHPR
ncbi:MAG: helix-turn-helix domain-containing protein [Pseudomonadota bacterium]